VFLEEAYSMRRTRNGLAVVTGVVALLAFAASPPAGADMAMQKKAKELKIASVQNCQSCHTDKVPKKSAAAVNEMGKWLVDQKKEKKAKEVDVAWLKDYKPKAK
jgi:mono/diheme cytochrome c family protein